MCMFWHRFGPILFVLVHKPSTKPTHQTNTPNQHTHTFTHAPVDMTDDTCDGAQTGASDYNTYDCTLPAAVGSFDPKHQCWQAGDAPKNGLARTSNCYLVNADKTLTEADADSCATTGVYNVYLVDSKNPTLSSHTCSPTTDGTTPCIFADAATKMSDVFTTAACENCKPCPPDATYVIGVGPFAFSS